MISKPVKFWLQVTLSLNLVYSLRINRLFFYDNLVFVSCGFPYVNNFPLFYTDFIICKLFFDKSEFIGCFQIV